MVRWDGINCTCNVVLPEFRSFVILPLFMMATLLAVIVYKTKRFESFRMWKEKKDHINTLARALHYAILSVLHHSAIFLFVSSLFSNAFGKANSPMKVEFGIKALVFSTA